MSNLIEIENEVSPEEMQKDGFEVEVVADLKLNSSPIRKLSKFYAKARTGRPS